MAKDKNIQMPTSGGGLVRYSDGSRSKLQFKPEHVIILVVVVIIIQIIIHSQAAIWFGS
ncbi:MAG: preprotein translocase subunit Sec61beta [Nanoarchaeota archaeon]